MEWIEPDRGDRIARSVGAALVAEAWLLAASRLYTLVYVVAREVDLPDKHKTSGSVFLVFLILSIALVIVVAWAGVQLRRTPAGAWRVAGVAGRVDLALAGIVNLAAAAWAVVHLVTPESLGAEAAAAWVIVALVATAVMIGLIRDAANRARPTVER